jgi:hypothetical protein
MDREPNTAFAARRLVVVGALLPALLSSSGCLTAVTWSWALPSVEGRRATGESRSAQPRADKPRVSGTRVAVAAILTPIILGFDVCCFGVAVSNGFSDYNPLWGFESMPKRKKARAPTRTRPGRPAKKSRPPVLRYGSWSGSGG